MRDTDLKSLRPKIPTIIEGKTISPAELFQNRTLRPILKLQNDLLLLVFKQYIQKRKGVFYQLDAPKKRTYISDSLRKDLRFKHFLIGIITGHFTIEEWKKFAENESELTRRITEMMVKRLEGQIEWLGKL